MANEAPINPEAAFEYLKTVETPSLEEYKIIMLLEAAGLALYRGMAEATPNTQVKELLLRNGQEEMAHAHRVKRAIKELWGEECEIPAGADNPYEVERAGWVITRQALESFAEAEFTGEGFYETWAAKLNNAEAARLLRQNGKEETQHGVRLREAAALLG